MASNYYPGDTFTCSDGDLKMTCIVKKSGFSCQSEDSIKLDYQLRTDIILTTRQRDWLQRNVIKYRKQVLKYRNEDHKAFRRALVTGKGTLFLA
jgi:hypothetical protein